MTEKRYQLRQEQLDYPIVNFCCDLVDTENNDKVICSFDNDIGTSKMVDLLNEQEERINELEKDLNDALNRIEERSIDVQLLKEENGNLKKENELKGDFRNFINEDIVRIKKENEQLKEENNRLKQDNEKTKESEENKQLKSKERYCVHCKHLYLDRIVGMWCDIHEGEWGNIDAEYCPDYEKEEEE